MCISYFFSPGNYLVARVEPTAISPLLSNLTRQLKSKQCSGWNVIQHTWPSFPTCFSSLTHHLCAQKGHFLFNFPSAPVLSFYLTPLLCVKLAKTKTVLSTFAFTTCWTLKHHVQIAISVQLNFDENKTCRQSNTTCPL